MITFQEVKQTFKDYNRTYDVKYGERSPVEDMKAVVVFAQSNFTQPYSEKSRSYLVTNRSGKAFFPMPSMSQSVIGDCLDGTDPGVRLDQMGWKVEYCYFI